MTRNHFLVRAEVLAFTILSFHWTKEVTSFSTSPLLPTSTTFLKKHSAIITRKISSAKKSTTNDVDKLEEMLDRIAHSVKLQVFDLDEGLYGYETKDQHYGLEFIRVDILDEGPSLGIELVEMAHGDVDGRGLVLISGTTPGTPAASHPIHPGDLLNAVYAGTHFAERLVGLNYDLTVEALKRARKAAAEYDYQPGEQPVITLELNRMIRRAPVRVHVEGATTSSSEDSPEPIVLHALAGENLRRLLLRKDIKLYDSRTKRFDMPYATGDCAGEGLCGTCLVQVKSGAQSLSPKDDIENLVTKGRPTSWRASCRAVVGADNKEADIRIRVHPQSAYDDELNPGVKTISSDE